MNPGEFVKCESGYVGTIVASDPARDYLVVDVGGELQCLLDREVRPVESVASDRAFVIKSRDFDTERAWIEWSDGRTESVDRARLHALQARYPWRSLTRAP